MKRWIVNAALCAIGPAIVLACGEPPVSHGSAAPPVASARASASASASATAARTEYNENDFVENESNRDPFHSYVIQTAPTGAKAVEQPQIKVKLAEYAVDELKLAAIVQAGSGARAMFMPPNNVGTTVYRGDYVGRAEIVHTGGANGPEYQLNWRVDKIRDGDVVLIREDRTNPAIQPATRVISLHPETDKKG